MESIDLSTLDGTISKLDAISDKETYKVTGIVHEYLENFFIKLTDFSKSEKPDRKDLGKWIYERITATDPLKENFKKFLFKLIPSFSFDSDLLISFFERVPLLYKPQDGRTSWDSEEFDYLKFLVHELFLYTIAVSLKYSRFEYVENLIYSTYFPKIIASERIHPEKSTYFHSHITSINPHYKTMGLNKVSPMSDLIINRVKEPMFKDDIIDADYVCHYIGLLSGQIWFPYTFIYRETGGLELFDKLVSKKHFKKMQVLFRVTDPSELITKISDLTNKGYIPERFRFDRWHVRPIDRAIDLTQLAEFE